jgi:hypothetical protein
VYQHLQKGHRNYCAEKEIPLNEVMGVVDTDFASDPAPSQLSDRLPVSMKSRPSRSMVAKWWSQEHPDIKLVDGRAEWLAGFYNRLGDNELHPADRDHLEELTVWHKTKENKCMDDTQPIAGPSH